MPAHPLLLQIRGLLAAEGNKTKAAAMQAYMKSQMPFHGVAAPALRELCKGLFADVSFADRHSWENTVLALWRGARFREERYATLRLVRAPCSRELESLQSLKVYEEMIVTGAWWDYVDEIAAHPVGALLVRYPDSMRRKMLTWSRSTDLWKRRTAILCQLGRKRETDLDLLYGCIEPAISSREFFLRKAIGWALRQYARTDPREVMRYVSVNAERLSPLSRREALKRV